MAKLPGDNVEFTFEDGDPICLVTYDFSGTSVPAIDQTCMSDAARDFRPGKPSLGTCTVAYHNDPNDVDQQAIYDSVGDGVKDHAFSILIKDAAGEDVGTYACKGFVTENPLSGGAIDETLLMTTTFQLVEKTYTAAVVTPLAGKIKLPEDESLDVLSVPVEEVPVEATANATIAVSVNGEDVDVEVVSE